MLLMNGYEDMLQASQQAVWLTWWSLSITNGNPGLQKRYDLPNTQNGDQNLPKQLNEHFNGQITYDIEKPPFYNPFLYNLGVFTPNLYSFNLFWALNITQMGQVCYFFLNLPIEVKPSLVPLVQWYLFFCNPGLTPFYPV